MARKSQQVTALSERGDLVGGEEEALYNDALPTVYANRLALTSTQHDVRIAFGRFKTPGLMPKYDIAVYLSYAAAKQLAETLTIALSAYEERFGEIVLEPKAKRSRH